MKNWLRAALLLSAVLFLTAGIASADSITYQFTGAVSASFELPVNPTVIAFTPGFDFMVMPTNLLINGAPSSDRLNFYNATGGGGGGFLAACGLTCVDISVAGPQLYSGPEGSPTMLGVVAGGVTLTDFETGAVAGTLTSSTLGSVSTPEPSATVLLGIGLLAVGLAALGFKPRLAVAAN